MYVFSESTNAIPSAQYTQMMRTCRGFLLPAAAVKNTMGLMFLLSPSRWMMVLPAGRGWKRVGAIGSQQHGAPRGKKGPHPSKRAPRKTIVYTYTYTGIKTLFVSRTRRQFGRAVDRGELDVPAGPQGAGGALEGAVEGLGRVGVAEHAPVGGVLCLVLYIVYVCGWVDRGR